MYIMYWLILKTGVVSLVGILLLHSLYLYFMKILTVPKVKDHVYIPASQYKELYKTMEQEPVEDTTMKDELKEYLQNLGTKSNTPSRSTSPVSAVTLRSTNTTPWLGDQVNQNELPTMGLDGSLDEDGPLPTFVDMT